MKKHNFNSLSQKMTFSYGCMFFFLVILLAFIYYAIAYYSFLDHHIRMSNQLAKVISRQVDDAIDTANRLQVRVLESRSISDYIFDKARTGSVAEDWKFRENLYAITGYNYEFYHMNIVNLEEGTIHTFGEEYSYKPYTASQQVQDEIIAPHAGLRGEQKYPPARKGLLVCPP